MNAEIQREGNNMEESLYVVEEDGKEESSLLMAVFYEDGEFFCRNLGERLLEMARGILTVPVAS